MSSEEIGNTADGGTPDVETPIQAFRSDPPFFDNGSPRQRELVAKLRVPTSEPELPADAHDNQRCSSGPA